MSPKDDVHTRLITSAARSVLRPVGIMQKGRSRTWLADHGWWLIVVEFQPSGWSRGLYLNVGCMWLWNVKTHLSFDVGHRVEEFHPFENEQQFGEVAERLVARALERVIEYRGLFPTIRQVSEYYVQNPPDDFWPHFNAAVAHALSAQMELGRHLLSKCSAATSDEPPWLTEARSVARTLAGIMHEEQRVRDFISDRVQEARRLQKLPPLHHIDFGSERVVNG